MKSYCITCAIILAASLPFVRVGAAASELPAWFTRVPLGDAKYLYYVGSSSGLKNLNEAREEAYRSAVNEAIRDCFGVVTQVENDQYLSETSSQTLTRVRESSEAVRIKGFEKVDSFVEIRDERFHVSSLYRYSLKEIERESSRLAGVTPDKTVEPITIDGMAFDTDLSLLSEPAGAVVWINGLPFGQTPLHIKGLLPPGPVHLRFDHPTFENESRDVFLVSGESADVHVLLRPARGHLIFENLPSGAAILIDRRRQSSDLRQFPFIAGHKYRVEVRHDDYQSLLFENLEFDRDEVKVISTPLIPRPARLTIATLPSSARLTIDQRDIGLAPYTGTIAPGRYTVVAHLEGLAETELVIDARPNGRSVHVLQLSKQMKTKEKETSELSTGENPTLVAFGLESAGAQFQHLDVPMGRLSLFVKSVGRNSFGYGLGLSTGTGEARVGRHDLTVNENIGARLNVNHEFQIFGMNLEAGIEPGFHAGSIITKEHVSQALVAQRSWQQSSLAAYLSFNLYSKSSGLFQLQFGRRDYGNCDSLQGTKTIFFNFFWGGFL